MPAGTGARITLLDRKARTEIEALVRTVEKIETAVEPRFQEHFVDAMAIPHRSAPFSNLKRAMQIPEVKILAGDTQDSHGRHRRRRGRAST